MKNIDWIKSEYRIHTKKVDIVHYGFRCSNCCKFVQDVSKYCPDCGGRYKNSDYEPAILKQEFQ